MNPYHASLAKSLLVLGLVFSAVFVLGAASYSLIDHLRAPAALAGGVSPSVATVATSSTMQIGPQEVKTVFAAREYCAARIVSVLNGAPAAMLSFDDDITPSATVGHALAASSTNALPADTYGCGAVRAYASASTTITRTELGW